MLLKGVSNEQAQEIELKFQSLNDGPPTKMRLLHEPTLKKKPSLLNWNSIIVLNDFRASIKTISSAKTCPWRQLNMLPFGRS